MKHLTIAILMFLLTLSWGNISFANSASNAAGTAASKQAKSLKQADDGYSVRVLIDGRWWTFYYQSDGSFIVAIPDVDE